MSPWGSAPHVPNSTTTVQGIPCYLPDLASVSANYDDAHGKFTATFSYFDNIPPGIDWGGAVGPMFEPCFPLQDGLRLSAARGASASATLSTSMTLRVHPPSHGFVGYTRVDATSIQLANTTVTGRVAERCMKNVVTLGGCDVTVTFASVALVGQPWRYVTPANYPSTPAAGAPLTPDLFKAFSLAPPGPPRLPDLPLQTGGRYLAPALPWQSLDASVNITPATCTVRVSRIRVRCIVSWRLQSGNRFRGHTDLWYFWHRRTVDIGYAYDITGTLAHCRAPRQCTRRYRVTAGHLGY